MAINSLKALNRDEDAKAGTTKGDGFSIDPELLQEEDDFNTRGSFIPGYWELPEVKEKIQSLADAYKRGDFVPPIVVKVIDGRVFVREGHRRRRAILLAISQGAEIRRIPVVEVKGDEIAQHLLIATANDGEPLSPLDRAVLYARFSRWGWSDAEIASRMNRSVEHVRQGLQMLEMPLELKVMIQMREVAAHYALELYREHGGEKTVLLLNEARDAAAAAALPAGGSTRPKPAKVTKKMLQKQPALGKKVVSAMHASMLTLTSRLDTIKPTGTQDRYILELSRADLEGLYALRDKLAASAGDADQKNPNQQSLLD